MERPGVWSALCLRGKLEWETGIELIAMIAAIYGVLIVLDT